MACSNYTHTPLPHFSTAALIDLIGKLNETCPHDLVDGIGLRDAVANALFQGEKSFFAQSLGRWSPYTAAIIFSRLIDFKLPLLQLISELPPTKEIMAERERAEAEGEPIEVERRSKLIALVYLSYASNGHPKEIEDLITCEAANRPAFEAAALALVADRGSNFWAVGVAIFGFSMAVMLKYVYIDAETFDVAKPQHIDIWSLSSSMTMVHIVPNVLLASIISVQQSPHTARRFLAQFEKSLLHQEADDAIDRMQTNWAKRDPDQQISNGAVPNWRPDRQYARPPRQYNAPPTFWRRVLDVVAFLIVTTGSAGAILLSAAVPPEGLNCRTVIKLIMVLIYVVKYAAQLLVNRMGDLSNPMKSTQAGILNRAGCYRQCNAGGECGVYPASATWRVVQKRLRGMYPGILFGFLGMQLIFCAGLLYVFREARKVFLQDDAPLTPGHQAAGAMKSPPAFVLPHHGLVCARRPSLLHLPCYPNMSQLHTLTGPAPPSHTLHPPVTWVPIPA
ncbi:hypothetical protein MRS44_010792 [Fusarium solani]|uniref:uncharacterized protein n=1 Tax=Fusarium solani TaxID=169388 RepID=UPI0032C46799|nr:hypothetical protein MRS44_010792 [Fusarium solani]